MNNITLKMKTNCYPIVVYPIYADRYKQRVASIESRIPGNRRLKFREQEGKQIVIEITTESVE